MSGGPDPLCVRARTAPLAAADALTEQLDAVVLVAPGPHLLRSTEPLAKLLGLAAWRSPQFSW